MELSVATMLFDNMEEMMHEIESIYHDNKKEIDECFKHSFDFWMASRQLDANILTIDLSLREGKVDDSLDEIYCTVRFIHREFVRYNKLKQSGSTDHRIRPDVLTQFKPYYYYKLQ